MAELVAQITNEMREHAINYNGLRVRFQRSVDAGQSWVDVQANVRPVGTEIDAYEVPAGQNGHYRVGCALTDGNVMGAEVFSEPIQIATFTVMTPITVAIRT